MNDWLISQPIAHRGLHSPGRVPENSYLSFKKAIDIGLPFEIDVRLTGDENIIVLHDANLLRLTGRYIEVSQTSWKYISKLKLIGSNETIPLFDEFLEFVNGQVPVLIEIKNFGRPGIFEKKLTDRLRSYKGEFALQSFNPLSVKWFKENVPQFLRGQIGSKFFEDNIPFYQKYLLKNLIFNFRTKPHFINYNIDDLPNFPVSFFRKQGIPLLAWTVRTNEQFKKARSLCDNFLFENFPLSEIVR